MRGPVTPREFTNMLAKMRFPNSNMPINHSSSQAFSPSVSSPTGAPVLTSVNVGVALSGGVDSTALALLMSKCASINQPVIACQIDHALRVDSVADVKHCQQWLSEHGLKHVVSRINWSVKPSISTMQNAARDRRYEALEAMCRANDIKYLFLAHTADDRRETFLHRLTRGSGLHGLATAIPPITKRRDSDLTIVRPLLNVDKVRLIDTCREFGVEWRDDPSNQNTQFERVRIRKALADIRERTTGSVDEPSQLETLIDSSMDVIESCWERVKDTVDMFVETSCRFEHPSPSRSLTKKLFNLGKTYETPTTAAPCTINLSALFAFNEELQIMVLSHLLHRVRGDGYSARHWLVTKRIRELVAHVTKSPDVDKSWLAHGCKLKYISKEHALRIERVTQITAASVKS